MKRTLFLFLLFMMAGVHAHAQSIASEEELKAAYIFHFISFTTWEDQLNNYYVCVPDNPDLKEVLRDLLKDKRINNRSVVVLDRGQVCHVMVSDNPPIFSTNILTIGPLNRGALLEFRLVENKLKFAANLKKIQTSNLKISSQLLKLAILENVQ